MEDQIELFKQEKEPQEDIKIVGIDEVGYGPWAGPLFVCACKFLSFPEFEIKDSKKLSAKQREEIFEKLKSIAVWEIAIAEVSKINEIGLALSYKATILSASKNFQNKDSRIFIDGRKPKWLECTAVIKGDDKVPQIAAASIIAKVKRDAYMQKLHEEFPQYGWASNKGYGTAKHIEAIRENGLTQHHRINYKPFADMKDCIFARGV